MYHKEWDRAMTCTILFDEFAEDIKKEREAAAAEANARADKEKSRADEANARADKYAAILKELGLLKKAILSSSTSFSGGVAPERDPEHCYFTPILCRVACAMC